MTGSLTPEPGRALARLDPLFPGDSELGRVMAGWDWSSNPLGPPHTWPPELRNTVRILLTSRFPMWMGWGSDLRFFYNDAYRSGTLRDKHPWALGRPVREVWAEIWEDLRPRMESVLNTGTATWDSELLLFLNRSGFREETYHTFSYSPLQSADGAVAGLLCVVTEDTDRVLAERRMATLRDLASGMSAGRTRSEVLAAAASALARDDRALPFTLTYLFGPDGVARLAARTGIPEGHPVAPAILDPGEPDPVWPVRRLRGGDHLEVVLSGYPDLPTGAWDDPPERAVVVPFGPDIDAADGFLVVGLNPYRPWDGPYRDFVGLLAGQLSAGLTAAGAFEDERRRAEGLAELDRAKTDFFSNVSHEFRTPLTLILGPVQDLREAPELDEQRVRTELAAVYRNAQRLGRLVDTLLEFSRLQSGRVAARFEPTDLSRLTAELAGVFRSAVERAGLRLDVDCPPLSAPVLVDREMWEKIVLNLLSNAVKFTVEGGITVSLREHDGMAELAVADTGTGIPAEELPRLFERFHRVRGARGRSREGTGIGLALVRELAGSHGGRVGARPEPGGGTRFTVAVPMGEEHLPAEQVVRTAENPPTRPSVSPLAAPFVIEVLGGPEADGAADPPGPSMPADPLATPRRVLVADDNADMRAYLGRLLSGRYQVDSVSDGDTALRRALADPPDLVVSDIMMPGLDGMGLLAALRADSRTSRVPVLLLSARAGEEAAVEGLAAGADDYLVKPFSAAELLARVGAHVQLGRLRREAEARFTAMADLAPALIWLSGPDGARVFVNSGWREYTGRDAAADLGDGWWAAVHPQDRERYREVTSAARAAGEGWTVEYRLARADGTYHWLLEHAAPIAGGAGGHVGSCTDIHARYRESERQRLLAEVSTALDTVSGPGLRMQRLADLLVRRRLADLATVVRVGPRGGSDRIALAAADPEVAELVAASPPESPATRQVARTLRPLLLDPLVPADMVGEGADEQQRERGEALRQSGANSAILVPLVARGRLLAVLGTTRAAESPAYTADDLGLLEEVAERAGMSLENALLLTDERDTAARLAVLQGATAELSAAATPDQVADTAITHLRQLLGADTRVFVYEYESSAERLVLLRVGEPTPTPRWPAIEVDAALPVARAFREGRPVWVRHPGDVADEDRELREQVADVGVRAFAALPLSTAGGRVGAVVVGFGEPRTLTATERTTLLALAEQCAQALDRARLYRAEQRIADTLQRSLLPAHLPRPERLALAAQYLPGAAGTQAGGDWYDVIELDAQRVAIAVGDVVGQGPAAAAVMGRLSAALSAGLRQGYRPAAALELLDNYASAIPGAIASTAACLTLDTASGELRWARAGHLPPLVIDGEATRFLDDAHGHGPILGLPHRPPYTEGVTTLRPGATLLAFTDGLVERRGEVVDEGLDRLRRNAEELGGNAPAPFLAALIERLTDAGPPDDIAAVCARLLPEPLHLTAPARAGELGGIRRRVRRWAARLGLSADAVTDLVQTVDETTANSAEHAYPDRAGTVSVTLVRRASGAIAARVSDHGHWRSPPDDPGFRGHGLRVVDAIADGLTVKRGPGGTDVEFTLPPREPEPPEPAASPARFEEHRRPRLRVLGEDRYLLVGDLDRGGADELRPELIGALVPGREVSVRLGVACYLSSSGAALLAEAVAVAADGGGRLSLVAAGPSQALRALELVGLTVDPD